MLPAIGDLSFHNRGPNLVVLRWTSPPWLLDPRLPITGSQSAECKAVTVVDYDVRFREHPGIVTEQDFYQATKIRYRSPAMGSNDPNAFPLLNHTTDGKTSFLGLHFFPDKAAKHLRSQFRERRRGYYAVSFKDANQGWSPISNVIYDDATGAENRLHNFEIRVNFGGSFGEGLVTGLMVLEIRDPYTGGVQIFTVNPTGLSVGAPVGATESLDGSWTTFQPYRHLHLKDFAGLGVHILSQGVAIKRGYARMELIMYETERDAMIKRSDSMVAGPINLDGFTKGYELTGLSKTVGTLDPL